jgi:hypothetical protein
MEDFAVQFQDFNNQRTEWGHTIILIHNKKKYQQQQKK